MSAARIESNKKENFRLTNASRLFFQTTDSRNFKLSTKMGQSGSREQLMQEVMALDKKAVPTFVMMPLDAHTFTEEQMDRAFSTLVKAGAAGIMCDVWWGLCEPAPGLYDFSAYAKLFAAAQRHGLLVQATMSFHKCGGNVGDSVNIPLPQWVLNLQQTVPDLFYKGPDGQCSDDYISLSCDDRKVFPTARRYRTRTALDCYEQFMYAFDAACGRYCFEIQCGVGPCGELRYPAYQLSRGWEYPNIGHFMCYDDGMLQRMKAEIGRDLPPTNAGHCNNRPDETEFFSASAPMHGDVDTFRSHSGRTFLEWYSNTLIQHGDAVLKRARRVFPRKLISCKVAGIHWLNAHPSKAAELTAGYYGDYLQRIAFMFAKNDVVFDFTCLEMYTSHQAPETLSRPERLVAQAMHAAKVAGIEFAGENALPIGWDGHCDQVVRQLKKGMETEDVHIAGFTFLRMTDDLVDENSEAFQRMCRFFGFLNDLDSFEDMGEHKDCPSCAKPVHLPEHVVRRVKAVAAPDAKNRNSWHALNTVARRRLSEVLKNFNEASANANAGSSQHVPVKAARTPSRLRREGSMRGNLRREKSFNPAVLSKVPSRFAVAAS